MTRLTLRHLTSADLPFADSLRAIAGWNQTLTDWQRFLDLSPNGCLLAECEGRPVATATTTCYGGELGWIGMMLVHPDFRRRGIARVLLEHCIEILRHAGIKSIKLDATPAGREVYARMGFVDECVLTRFQREGGVTGKSSAGVRAFRSEDFARIVALDTAATGAQREELLQLLIAQSERAVVREATGGELAGFGILRAGSLASYLGPVVATDAESAREIADALIAEKTFCDLHDTNKEAIAWAESSGFKPQRSLTRMFLGENVKPAAPKTYFAIAAPDLG